MKKELYFILLVFIALTSCNLIQTDTTNSKIIYQDNLKVDQKTWTSDSTNLHVRKFYQGHYSLKVDSMNIISYSIAPYGTLNFPYSVQVDATAILDNSDMRGNVGIVFNFIDKSNFDVAEISTNGTYHLWSKVDGDNENIVSSTISSAINSGSGSKNTLKLIQTSDSLVVQINSITVGSFPVSIDDSYLSVGVCTSTVTNDFTPVTGLFNNFILSKLDD